MVTCLRTDARTGRTDISRAASALTQIIDFPVSTAPSPPLMPSGPRVGGAATWPPERGTVGTKRTAEESWLASAAAVESSP